jgi:hypothetical protein
MIAIYIHDIIYIHDSYYPYYEEYEDEYDFGAPLVSKCVIPKELKKYKSLISGAKCKDELMCEIDKRKKEANLDLLVENIIFYERSKIIYFFGININYWN